MIRYIKENRPIYLPVANRLRKLGFTVDIASAAGHGEHGMYLRS